MRSDGYLIGEADLLPLSLGAALLGTGGGGNPYIGMLRARELVRKGAEIRVIPLEALKDDEWVSEVGGIGAPVVGVEKIEEGGECLRAMRAVEEASGKRFSAVISAEIGGANAMEPLIAAALAGIPAVDGDGMGRAFPEVQMTTYMIYGADVSPAAIADEKGNVVVFRDIIDMYWLERFARDVAVGMGAGAGLAVAPMRGDFVRRTAVPGYVSKHQKSRRQGQPGGIYQKERALDASNVMLICPKCGKATRTGHKAVVVENDKGEKISKNVRVCKRCAAEIE